MRRRELSKEAKEILREMTIRRIREMHEEAKEFMKKRRFPSSSDSAKSS